MKITGNEPVYPFLKWNEAGYGDSIVAYDANGGKQFFPYESGLTKREYFAALAMQSLLPDYQETLMSPQTFHKPQLKKYIAQEAVEMADMLIEELNK